VKLLIAGILSVSVALSGCYTMRVYKFQRDRVDQVSEGNRGYITGTPPPASAGAGTPKRELIGIDIELGLLPGEKARVDFGKEEERVR
jgi:hypothetical protein